MNKIDVRAEVRLKEWDDNLRPLEGDIVYGQRLFRAIAIYIVSSSPPISDIITHNLWNHHWSFFLRDIPVERFYLGINFTYRIGHIAPPSSLSLNMTRLAENRMTLLLDTLAALTTELASKTNREI